MTSGWDEYFGKRRWRVAVEVTGTDTAEPGTAFNLEGDKPVQVRFARGKFEIDGGVFHSPLSSARGGKGVLLQEIDPKSGDDLTSPRIAVGVVVLRRARKEGAVK